MIKNLLTVFFAIALFMGLSAQQQLNNPGFETWEDVGIGTDEPTHWNSIKTSDNTLLNPAAPIVWGKSTDAHSGQYSLKLWNVATFGIVATGTITNGQVHSDLNPNNGYVFTNLDDDRFHTAFNQRPDSLTGWYKANPATNDFGTVKIVLHRGYLSLPGDEANIIATAYLEFPSATVNTWTRFSIPFEYVSEETPEYFLSVITAGNGVNAVEGSEIWYDDLAFVYNPSNIDEQSLSYFHVYQQDNDLVVQVENSHSQPFSCDIVNMNGQTIASQKGNQGSPIRFTLPNHKPGLYLVVVRLNRQFHTRKIILN